MDRQEQSSGVVEPASQQQNALTVEERLEQRLIRLERRQKWFWAALLVAGLLVVGLEVAGIFMMQYAASTTHTMPVTVGGHTQTLPAQEAINTLVDTYRGATLWAEDDLQGELDDSIREAQRQREEGEYKVETPYEYLLKQTETH